MMSPLCGSPIGLGGRYATFPFQGFGLGGIIQRLLDFFGGMGFQTYPFMGQNLGVLQVIHPSIFSSYPNIAYTVRLCQSPGFLGVETGHAGLLSLPGMVDDYTLHNSLLSALGTTGGLMPYAGMIPEDSLFSLIGSML